jgi:alkaline phosphatase
MNLIKYIFTAFFALSSLGNAQLKSPKNVIIMISDGCGYNHIQATDLYQNGEFNSQKYESFPYKYFVSTYPAKADQWDKVYYNAAPYSTLDAWTQFDYVNHNMTCSSAAGTAISTGVKTYNGAVCMDLDRNKLKNLSDLAKEKHKAAGVVTSVEWSHATPACFVAHNESRENYSQIAKEMIFDSKMDVVMGCGHPYYDANGVKKDKPNTFKYVGDSLTWNMLQKGEAKLGDKSVQDIDGDGKPDAWTFIEKKEDFEKLCSGKAPKRVIGTAQVYQTLQQSRGLKSDNYFKGDKIGEEDPKELLASETKTVPELKTMALGALNVLKNNENGFFLMVEGGAIDWAAHSNQTGRMIAEEINFNKTVESVIDWIETNSSWDETLLIVTADHETGYITAPYNGEFGKSWETLPKTPKGQMPNIQWNSLNHTNSLVPLFAKGQGGQYFKIFADETDIKRGRYINNTEIAQLIFLLWE